jgi:hypothetical protein
MEIGMYINSKFIQASSPLLLLQHGYGVVNCLKSPYYTKPHNLFNCKKQDVS